MSGSTATRAAEAGRRAATRTSRRRQFDVAFYMPSLTPLLAPENKLPPSGGAETQVFLISRGLARRGVRVAAVVEASGPGRLPAEVDGVAIICRPPYRAHSPLVGKLREAARIWQTLRTIDAEVLVKRMCGVDVGIVAAFARLSGARFVYSSASVADFSPEQLLPKRRDVRLFEMGVRKASQVVVQTEEQVGLCRTRFGVDPVLISSIAEPAEPAMGEPSYFLWAGRLVDYKNPMGFIELARAVPEARFVMVGVPHGADAHAMELARAVRAEAAALSNVQMVAPLPRADLTRLLDQAVAVVNTGHHEGMPNVMLEAWARGVPALALEQDPDSVIMRHGLGGFAANSPEVLARLARRMWAQRGDPAQRARCRRYIALNHSESAVVERWIDLISPDLR